MLSGSEPGNGAIGRCPETTNMHREELPKESEKNNTSERWPGTDYHYIVADQGSGFAEIMRILSVNRWTLHYLLGILLQVVGIITEIGG